MSIQSQTRKLLSTALICGLAGGAQSALAATTYYFYDGAAYPSYLTGTIRADTNGTYSSATNSGYERTLSVGAGGFKMTPDLDGDRFRDANEMSQSLITWCVDVFHTVASAKYTEGTLSNLTSYLATKMSASSMDAGDLQSLVNQRYTTVQQQANNTYSAAFQLALWEIVNETSGTYDLNSGSFKASGFSTTALNTAQTWLALNGDNTGNYKVSYLFDFNGESSPNTQNLITMSPVPLPAAGLLMLSALGLGGLMTKRRGKAKQ